MRTLTTIVTVGLLAACGAFAAGEPLPARVERAAIEAARGAIEEPDRYEVESVRFGGADPVASPPTALRVTEIDGPDRAGRVRVRLTMLDDAGVERGTTSALVYGAVRGPALVARRMLRLNEAIPADAVALEPDVDLTRLTGTPVRDPAALAALGPRRSLGAGRALTDALLAPLPVIRRNVPVDLVVRRGSLVVRTKGRVRRDAAPGETVVAENLRTGAEIVGRVQEDGSVLVVHGATLGRAPR